MNDDQAMKLEIVQQCNVCGGALLEVVDAESNITECSSCGYVFDNPRPTLEELIKFYSRPSQYDSWLGELKERDRAWNRRLSILRSTRQKGALLDVGAGIGQFLSLARDCYDQVYGTEVSSEAVRIAKEKYNLELFQGTIEDFEKKGRLFDNVTLFHVLEHVPDPRSLLRICHSLLSDHGILVIAVPNEVTSLRAWLKRQLVKAGLRKPRGVGKFGLPRIKLTEQTSEVHLSHFTPAVLRRLLQSAGFSILKTTLDPCYVATGTRRLKADLYYSCCLLLHKGFRVNLYDGMLMIARKASVRAQSQSAA
jgi:2-polyprenyl-3-methyl-5-hydroxy-6-metoxy-1,4-benzoquinol methylase